MKHLGQIVTFYSYKGGVGRSMAVANVGALLAHRAACVGERVLLIDWDLEAPGLYTFFSDPTDDKADKKPGLLEYFTKIRDGITDEFHRRLLESPELLEDLAPLDSFVESNVFEALDMMPAGIMSPVFARQVAEFDWSYLWARYPGVFSAFRAILSSRYSWVLIDSRTGLNDVSGICTALMPEKLVTVFALTSQHLMGTLRVICASIEFRSETPDLRPLSVFPLASRIEASEYKQLESWLLRFRRSFERTFRTAYGVEQCDLSEYFREIFLPYVPYFAFGERLVVTSAVSRAGSLPRAYEQFCDRLANLDYPWQTPEEAKENLKREQEILAAS